MVERTKDVYRAWLPIHRDMARTERFGIGTRIDSLFLDLLDLLRKTTYANGEGKIGYLSEAIVKTDALRFFLQLAWEAKIVPNKQYIALAAEIEEVGRMIGGWKKGLLTKTPPKGGGERQE
ncbi:MAG: four helix bundle protein [Candidatus Micrarchaeaceae archaeon]